jgi:hypothetical protein
MMSAHRIGLPTLLLLSLLAGRAGAQIEFDRGRAVFPGTNNHEFTSAGTIEAWVSLPPDAWATGGIALAVYDRILSGQKHWLLQIFSDGSVQAISYPNPAVGSFRSPADTFPFDGRWHHLAFSRDASGSCTIWLDGQPQLHGSFPGSVHSGGSNVPTSIGPSSSSGLATAGKVQVRCVRVSNTDRYSSAFSPPPTFAMDTNTIFLAQLREGTGTTTLEEVSGQTGDLEGGYSWIPDSDRDDLPDAEEDLNANGQMDPGETDPFDQDTDDDGLSDGEEVYTSRTDTRWLVGPNGHYYRLAPAATWSQASAAARAQGYELTSVQDEAEAIWLSDTFGDVGDGFWIGLTDFTGTFQWSDGDLSSYRRWATGEPNTSFVAAWVGGPSSAEPGYWYADPAGATPRLAVWESPGPDAPTTALDPLAFDTDGDGLGDGQEDGVDAIVWDGGGISGVTGTDPLVFIPDADPLTTTDPLDLDSDEDGIEDGDEDLDGDGAASPGETDAALADTDGDGLPDGLELGLTAGSLDTNGAVFIPDADPLTTTDPLAADTDGGGVPDGAEDQSADGAVDTWETDPNLAADEALAFYVSQFESNKTVLFEVFNATPRVLLVPLYSRLGPGPTATTLGVTLDLSMPITALRTTFADAAGYAAWAGPNLPTLPPGLTAYWQAVEIPFSPVLPARASNPIVLPAGAN